MPLPANAFQTSFNDRLELYVRRVVSGSDLPMFSKRLIELLALPNSDQTSAQKLAALVLEDYALTFKLLRIYRQHPTGAALKSVTQLCGRSFCLNRY